MVIIAYRLAQGWAGPGGCTVITGRVPLSVYFKLLQLSQPLPPSHQYPIWISVCLLTKTCLLPDLHDQQPHLCPPATRPPAPHPLEKKRLFSWNYSRIIQTFPCRSIQVQFIKLHKDRPVCKHRRLEELLTDGALAQCRPPSMPVQQSYRGRTTSFLKSKWYWKNNRKERLLYGKRVYVTYSYYSYSY